MLSGLLPFLEVEDCLSLDNAMTNPAARPLLVESYRDMQPSGFNEYV